MNNNVISVGFENAIMNIFITLPLLFPIYTITIGRQERMELM